MKASLCCSGWCTFSYILHICPTRRSNICTRQYFFPPKHLKTHFPGRLKRQTCRFLHTNTNTTDATCFWVCGVPRARCGRVKHPPISSAAEVRRNERLTAAYWRHTLGQALHIVTIIMQTPGGGLSQPLSVAGTLPVWVPCSKAPWQLLQRINTSGFDTADWKSLYPV